jgi:hypothetical protein
VAVLEIVSPCLLPRGPVETKAKDNYNSGLLISHVLIVHKKEAIY